MIYNPLDKHFKSITGASKHGEQLRFRVKGNFGSVLFVYFKDGESAKYIEMQQKGNCFEVSLLLDIGLYFYSFLVDGNSYISCGKKLNGQLSSSVVYYQHTVYDSNYDATSWLKGGIIYQIFPDRFNIGKDDGVCLDDRQIHTNLNDTPYFLPDENGKVQNCDFFGGNIQGIIDKLDYLKELNVTCIYLNPIFKAYSNHRYDTGDYMTIDPLLGNLVSFKKLIDKANDYGIRVILDGVFNHTGDDSIYFNKYNNYNSIGAYNDKKSPYISWFNFMNYPDEYKSWWGITTLPATNKAKDSGYVNFIAGEGGVIDFYTNLNIGGWRLDVVDELPSHFVKKIRQTAKKVNENAIIIGEVWEDATNKISYNERREYFWGNELDSIMNYPLKNAILDFCLEKDFDAISETILTEIDHFPKQSLDNLMNILSTHDTFRLLSSLSGVNAKGLSKEQQEKIVLSDEQISNAKKRLKIASLLQFTLCGVPSIYYGDEIAMQGFADPLNRKFFSWDKIDSEILEWYKILGKIRSGYSCFERGDYKEIYCDKGKYLFKRYDNQSALLIAVNLSDNNLDFMFSGKMFNLIDNKEFNGKISLEKFQFGVYVAI